MDCEPSTGGLKVVYIANYDDVQNIEIEDGQIVGITMDTDKLFKTYTFRRNTASMTSTENVDATNGTLISTDVVLSFLQQENQKRIEISKLSIGELVMIVQDMNGRYWYLGKDLPVMASAGSAESGTIFTDGNRYTITLQDQSKEYPFEVKVAPSSAGDTKYVNIDELINGRYTLVEPTDTVRGYIINGETGELLTSTNIMQVRTYNIDPTKTYKANGSIGRTEGTVMIAYYNGETYISGEVPSPGGVRVITDYNMTVPSNANVVKITGMVYNDYNQAELYVK